MTLWIARRENCAAARLRPSGMGEGEKFIFQGSTMEINNFSDRGISMEISTVNATHPPRPEHVSKHSLVVIIIQLQPVDIEIYENSYLISHILRHCTRYRSELRRTWTCQKLWMLRLIKKKLRSTWWNDKIFHQSGNLIFIRLRGWCLTHGEIAWRW